MARSGGGGGRRAGVGGYIGGQGGVWAGRLLGTLRVRRGASGWHPRFRARGGRAGTVGILSAPTRPAWFSFVILREETSFRSCAFFDSILTARGRFGRRKKSCFNKTCDPEPRYTSLETSGPRTGYTAGRVQRITGDRSARAWGTSLVRGWRLRGGPRALAVSVRSNYGANFYYSALARGRAGHWFRSSCAHFSFVPFASLMPATSYATVPSSP
jgi:hypothetical protein